MYVSEELSKRVSIVLSVILYMTWLTISALCGSYHEVLAERAIAPTRAHFFLLGLILLSQNSPFQSPFQSRHQNLHQETITLRFYPLMLTTKTRAERRFHLLSK